MSAARDVALALLAGRRPQRLPDGGYLVPCPVPSHGRGRGDRNPSLHINDGQTQLLVRCYSGCDVRDVLDVLRRRGLLDDDTYPRNGNHHPPTPARGSRFAPSRDEAARIRRAREIWRTACDPRDTLAQTYFGIRRLTLDGDLAGHVLRFHPRCRWWNESAARLEFVPALIAAFRSLDDNEITGIHRIALKPDGHKLGKRMLGVVHRAAVKLDGDVGDELAIGEGVETCVAARLLGIRPTWALGSAGGIKHFPILPSVRTLRIIGENDRTSEEAIELCGQRWQAAGRRVRVIRPPLDCNDLNDAVGRACL